MMPLQILRGMLSRIMAGRDPNRDYPEGVQTYANLNGNSGITQYEIDPSGDSMRIQFKGGTFYDYPVGYTGRTEMETMKDLAMQGSDLNKYINSQVRRR